MGLVGSIHSMRLDQESGNSIPYVQPDTKREGAVYSLTYRGIAGLKRLGRVGEAIWGL